MRPSDLVAALFEHNPRLAWGNQNALVMRGSGPQGRVCWRDRTGPGQEMPNTPLVLIKRRGYARLGRAACPRFAAGRCAAQPPDCRVISNRGPIDNPPSMTQWPPAARYAGTRSGTMRPRGHSTRAQHVSLVEALTKALRRAEPKVCLPNEESASASSALVPRSQYRSPGRSAQQLTGLGSINAPG
jgi:hypothetical protein